MDIPLILAEAVGAIALYISVIAPKFPERKQIVLCHAASIAAWALHFYLKEAYTAMGSCCVSSCYTLILAYFPNTRKTVILISLVFLSINAFITFSGISSIIAYLAGSTYVIARSRIETNGIRKFTALGETFWLIHHLLVQSIFGSIAALLIIYSNIRYYLKSQTA